MSSILEKLMILIQLDASGLKQGADQVQVASNKMNVALEKTAHRGNFLEHVFHHLKRELLGFTVSMIGFGAALEGVKSTVEYFSKIGEAADKLQVNVEMLDAWNQAVIKSGGTAESFDESLKHVSKTFNTSNATILKVLPQFADAFHRLSTQKALNWGKKIGFDEATIMLLHQGGKAVDELIAKQKSLGVITKEQKETLDKYNAAWADTKQQLRFVAFEAELGLLPTLTKLTHYLGETIGFFNRHHDFVKSFVTSFAAMSVAAYLFGKKAKVAGEESEIAAARSARGWKLSASKIALAAAAISLAYDDWQAFKKGDDSVIGDITKKWPVVGNIIVSVFREIDAATKSWLDTLEAILELLPKLNSSPSDWSSSKKSRDFLRMHLPGFFYESAGDLFGKARTSISEANAFSSYGMMHGSGLGALKNTVNKNGNINIGKIDIVVSGQSTDAQGLSNYIGKALYDHLFQAQSQFDDGQVI